MIKTYSSKNSNRGRTARSKRPLDLTEGMGKRGPWIVPIAGPVGEGETKSAHPRAHLPSLGTLQRAVMTQLNRSHSSRVE